MISDYFPSPPAAEPQAARVRRRIGELLTADGVLTEQQLAQALEAQRAKPGPRERLGQTVVRLGMVTEQAVARSLANQLGLEHLEGDDITVDEGVASLVSPAIAERHRLLPLRREGDTLVVACSDPTDVVALDDVRLASGSRRVRAVVATPTVLGAAIRRAYGLGGGRANELLDAITDDGGGAETAAAEELSVDDGPVVRLAEGIIAEAVKSGASDIHVEPGDKDTAVRYRVDGVLNRVMLVPRAKAGALVSRLKIMSGMDIAEKRRPQDGRATFRTGGRSVDLRVSSLPSLHGETLVMRILRKGAERLGIEQVGFTDTGMASTLSAIERPQGLVLITGPTGSGKTSTLYSFLGHLAGESNNIITLEDPVEYELPGVNQTQINERIGFTFAKALRTVLRQDPDVVMVGEIRDPETAELALQASLTGHLVFSTLHTNNASGAIVRLRDLGIPSYLVAASVTLVIAQRLVRTLCTECAQPAPPSERVLAQLGLSPRDVADDVFLVGGGCSACSHTGYRGRLGVFEIIPVDAAVRELLSTGASESALRRAARISGMTSLREDGLRLARAGRTTLEEVLRVTPADVGEAGACPVCAQQVEPEFALCPWCGVHLRPDACERCEHPLETGWRVCPTCGTPVPGEEAPDRLPRVVVADADPVVLASITAMLEDQYEVMSAVDGESALEAVRTGRPDVLLLDLGLPGIDGYGVAHRVRARPASSGLPIVLMTADGSRVTELAQRRAGADAVVLKPFTREALLVRLHAALHAQAA